MEEHTLSALTVADCAAFLRLSETDAAEEAQLGAMLDAAVRYILGYTGLTEESADEKPDLVIAALVLVQDMWDNRALYIDVKNGGTANRTVESILNLHSVRLL